MTTKATRGVVHVSSRAGDYGQDSTDEQARECAERIADALRAAGYDARFGDERDYLDDEQREEVREIMERVTEAFWRCLDALTVTQIAAADLPCDLRAESEATAGGEAYRVEIAGEAERVHVLAYPAAGRYGVAWGATAAWTDAESIEDAVERYLSGRMVQ